VITMTAPGSPYGLTASKGLLRPTVWAVGQQAQADLDRWVTHYNLEREHQAIGDMAPIRRFELVDRVPVEVLDPDADTEEPPPGQ
jgi:transposase InsO family protein